MPWSRLLGFSLLLLLALPKASSADPMLYRANEIGVSGGFLAVGSVGIDLQHGGTYQIADAVFGDGPLVPGPGDPMHTKSIDGSVWFVVGQKGPPGSPDWSTTGPTIDVSGQFQGKIIEHGFGYDGGSVSGGATHIDSNGNSPLPQDLLDLVNHPERIHFSGFVTGGRRNELPLMMTIDPPGPDTPITVPEPASYAGFLVLTAGALLSRHAHRPTRGRREPGRLVQR